MIRESDGVMRGSGIAPTALVIGGSGFIGKELVICLEAEGWKVLAPDHKEFDLLNPPKFADPIDVIYICAAMTKFIDCESNPLSYRINVDGPRRVAELYPDSDIIYLSSEAVERALHTAYGMQKALAEISLHPYGPIIIRLSKVPPHKVFECCDFLIECADVDPGIYRWKPTETTSSDE